MYIDLQMYVHMLFDAGTAGAAGSVGARVCYLDASPGIEGPRWKNKSHSVEDLASVKQCDRIIVNKCSAAPTLCEHFNVASFIRNLEHTMESIKATRPWLFQMLQDVARK